MKKRYFKILVLFVLILGLNNFYAQGVGGVKLSEGESSTSSFASCQSSANVIYEFMPLSDARTFDVIYYCVSPFTASDCNENGIAYIEGAEKCCGALCGDFDSTICACYTLASTAYDAFMVTCLEDDTPFFISCEELECSTFPGGPACSDLEEELEEQGGNE